MKRALIVAVVLVGALSVAAAAEGGSQTKPDKEKVTLKTSDGVSISASFVKAGNDKSPAVVLLHMLSRTKEDWDPVLEEYLLPRTEFSYLAIDLRGHGESTVQNGETLDWENFSETDFNNMVRDVQAAVDYLRSRKDIDPDRIAIVGASIGANVAINYAAKDPKIKAVALLSAGRNYKGVATFDAMREYGNRPVFLAASKEDMPAGRNIRGLAKRARGTKVVKLFPGNLHGTRMFGACVLDGPLVAFLKESLTPATPAG
ncbi:MAG: alpha/beta fold hydrolase [Planctomycetes bacterium]|nr:alpha/beta fold hydrolase [Planctomycetota bacterium]